MKSPTPTLHPGGSAYENLFEALSKARLAVREAYDLFIDTRPHPRDFPGRDEDFEAAKRVFENKKNQLMSIESDLYLQLQRLVLAQCGERTNREP